MSYFCWLVGGSDDLISHLFPSRGFLFSHFRKRCILQPQVKNTGGGNPMGSAFDASQGFGQIPQFSVVIPFALLRWIAYHPRFRCLKWSSRKNTGFTNALLPLDVFSTSYHPTKARLRILIRGPTKINGLRDFLIPFQQVVKDHSFLNVNLP